MTRVTIYSKPDCGLCDDAKALLERVRAETPFELQEIDIESDDALREKYALSIPVVVIDGHTAAKGRIEEATLRRKLRASGAAR